MVLGRCSLRKVPLADVQSGSDEKKQQQRKSRLQRQLKMLFGYRALENPSGDA